MGDLIHWLKNPFPESEQVKSMRKADELVAEIIALQAQNEAQTEFKSDSLGNCLLDGLERSGASLDDVGLLGNLMNVVISAEHCSGIGDIPSHTLSHSSNLFDCRKEILRLEDILHLAKSGDNAKISMGKFALAVGQIFGPYFPKESDSDADGDLQFPLQFFDSLPNPHALIDDFYSWFFEDTFTDFSLFTAVRNTLTNNASYAAKDEKSALFFTPRDVANTHSPKETMHLFFRGTPFVDSFNFSMPVSLPTSDRFKHQYVLGKTGSGKSVLLRGQIAQDIAAGRGIVIITPERGLLLDALSYVPPEREKDVIFFDPGSSAFPRVGFNPFDVALLGDELTLKAGEMEVILLRSLGDLGIKMRPIFSNTVYALLETRGSFTDIPKILDPHDNSYRQSIMPQLDERTREFFMKYDDSRYYKEAYEPIINRLDALLRPPLAHTLTTATLDFPDLLNRKSSIVLCNLSGLRGFQASIVGQLLLATFQQTFFQRDPIPEAKRLPYFFYMDEFQTYATSNEDSLKDFLQRARKYKVGIVMAHQSTDDIPSGLLSSIFGNCGTLMGMLMSAKDARKFAVESQLAGNDSKAYLQLQNFVAGQVAMSTPAKKKAIVLRVPEYPAGLKAHTEQERIISESKERYGVSEDAGTTQKQHVPVTGNASPPEAPEAEDENFFFN